MLMRQVKCSPDELVDWFWIKIVRIVEKIPRFWVIMTITDGGSRLWAGISYLIRKELGSWSDVTGSARCWNRVMVKCETREKGLGLALVDDGRLSFMFRCGMTDIEADGVGSDTLALWKDLGSGSDMTGSARWWIRFMTLNLMATFRGECEIQFPDYSEAIVVSMVILEFQATGPRLELVLCNRKKELASDSDVRTHGRLSFMFTVGMTDIEADGVGSETLALRKGFGSWSDVGVKMLEQGYDTLALWKDLGSGSRYDGECKMWIRVM
ncbi:hypothetical protein MUG91_G2145n1, partial [Manis pentadactyla]